MKNRSINKTLLIGILILIFGQGAYAQNLNCSETQKSDILRIHNFLTSPELKEKRAQSDIKEYPFKLSDLERQHTEAFRDYWKEKGVYTISNPDLCHKINDALNSLENIKGLQREYDRIYYKVKDQYVVLYRPKNSRAGIKKGQLPVQVLDEELNIVAHFRI